MADQRLLMQTLSEFAGTLVKGFTISDVLHDLAERATAVVGADDAGVSVQDAGRLRFATALDERSSNLERVQEVEQAGPCVDAPRDWSEEDLDAARVLADVATSYVINASQLEQQRRVNEQLQPSDRRIQ